MIRTFFGGLTGVHFMERVIRDLNKELAKGGYLVVAGKIPKAYLEQKLFGLKESEKEN